MCSCSTKGRANLVLQAKAEEEGAGTGVAKAEGTEDKVTEADATGKCNGITTWPLH